MDPGHAAYLFILFSLEGTRPVDFVPCLHLCAAERKSETNIPGVCHLFKSPPVNSRVPPALHSRRRTLCALLIELVLIKSRTQFMDVESYRIIAVLCRRAWAQSETGLGSFSTV